LQKWSLWHQKWTIQLCIHLNVDHKFFSHFLQYFKICLILIFPWSKCWFPWRMNKCLITWTSLNLGSTIDWQITWIGLFAHLGKHFLPWTNFLMVRQCAFEKWKTLICFECLRLQPWPLRCLLATINYRLPNVDKHWILIASTKKYVK
jgi:hypothetical protein